MNKFPVGTKGHKVISIAEIKQIWKSLKKYLLNKPKGVRGRSSDNTLIKKVVGWEPNTKLIDGLKHTYNWIHSEILNNSNKNKYTK